MKFLIAFILLIFSHCLVPTTSLATINATHSIAHTTVSSNKKSTFKARLAVKCLKIKRAFRVDKSGFLPIVLGAGLIVLGLLLLTAISSIFELFSIVFILGALLFGAGCILMIGGLLDAFIP
jgi:hypothetical protein